MKDEIYHKLVLPVAGEALVGRPQSLFQLPRHFVSGKSLEPPYADGMQQVMLGMGCFWGAERLFWSLPGVDVTAVGYAGGITPHPTYDEVCAGMTAHTEVVLVVFDPAVLPFEKLLKYFWENHNPTQGARQANDVGTQYRSAIYVATEQQRRSAETSKAAYQVALWRAGLGGITTEIRCDVVFYPAEDYHQQYLAKNPGGYCNLQSIQKTQLPSCPL